MKFCPDCGDEIGDYGDSGCGCTTSTFATRAPSRRTKEGTSRRIIAGGMRAMVQRKLRKQAAMKGDVG